MCKGCWGRSLQWACLGPIGFIFLSNVFYVCASDNHPRHRHHRPHQLQQQWRDDVDDQATSSDTEVYLRPATRDSLRHMQPSAPSRQTLLRPWTDTAPRSHDDEDRRQNDTTRPPPFNPSCPIHPPDHVEPSADLKLAEAVQDGAHLPGSCSTTSASDGGQNTLAPPSYDELYGSKNEDQQNCHQHHHQSSPRQQQRQRRENPFQTSSVTRTATDDSAGVCPSSLSCVAQFGHYADLTNDPQPGCFTHPTRISVRHADVNKF